MIIISSYIIWKIKLKYTFKKTNIAQFPQYIVLDNFWCMVKIVKTMSLKKKNTRTNLNNQHILYKINYHGINPGFSLSLITTQFLDINKKTQNAQFLKSIGSSKCPSLSANNHQRSKTSKLFITYIH